MNTGQQARQDWKAEMEEWDRLVRKHKLQWNKRELRAASLFFFSFGLGAANFCIIVSGLVSRLL